MSMEPNGGYDETARNQRIKQLAREQHQSDGECEIDDNALISEGDDNGTYVQAWVWVDFGGTDLDKGAHMKISTQEMHPGHWTAVDDNTYDGPGSAIGLGSTEQEAIDDLLEQIQADEMSE